MIDPQDTTRYDRQIRFPEIGADGQERLQRSVVAILGCGALGTVAAEILARAGVGQLRLIDRDVVEWSNLQRQALFDERDAEQGSAKASAAAGRLSQINSSIEIDPIVIDLTCDNIAATLEGADLVIDASDNFATRLLINDWSLQTKTAWVHGGCVGASGQIRLFDGQGGPCFRCLVPEIPAATAVETCDTAGVVGSATHLIASLQATEAIKWLTANRSAIRTDLLSIDLWHNRIRQIPVLEPHRRCPACQQGRLEFLKGTAASRDDSAVLCGRDAVQFCGSVDQSIDMEDAAGRWQGIGRVQRTPFFVRLHLDETTVTLFRDGRVMINGTNDLGKARILYDRYVGG